MFCLSCWWLSSWLTFKARASRFNALKVGVNQNSSSSKLVGDLFPPTTSGTSIDNPCVVTRWVDEDARTINKYFYFAEVFRVRIYCGAAVYFRLRGVALNVARVLYHCGVFAFHCWITPIISLLVTICESHSFSNGNTNLFCDFGQISFLIRWFWIYGGWLVTEYKLEEKRQKRLKVERLSPTKMKKATS